MNHHQSQPTAVALIKKDRRGLRATGAFRRFNRPFAGQAKPGDLIEVTHSTNKASKARALRHLGRPSSVQDVIAALAINAGEREFDESFEEQAADIAAAGEHWTRRDLTDLVTFTIDGEHTKDFDDALSARFEGDRIRVWVHVADVAAYIRPDTDLDREARRRATSVYLPTMTSPMLPRALSNGVCSLVPGKRRAAVTCEFLLDDGHVIERDFYRSSIRSDARLTYSHVENIFLGDAEPGPTYAAALAAARQAAIDRSAESAERGTEPVFEFTGNEVTGITTRPDEESQRLIERLMVLANQEVADFLQRRGSPTLYRTHATSDPERVKAMVARLASLGIDIDTEETTVAAAIAAVDRYEQTHGENDIVRSLLWGARAPAEYSRELSAHEGLGISAYCHFTSPIRRYADLVVHRALLAEIGAEDHEAALPYSQLPELAGHLNDRTYAAKKLERRAADICRVSLLRYRIRAEALPRQQRGRIAGMSPAGCFVRLDCADGLLHAGKLGGQPNAELTIWTTDSAVYRIGDTIKVDIRQLDPVQGKLELALLDQ